MCHKPVPHTTAVQQSWSLSLPAPKKRTIMGTQGIYRNVYWVRCHNHVTDQATLWPLIPCLVQEMLKSNLFQTALVRSDYQNPLYPIGHQIKLLRFMIAVPHALTVHLLHPPSPLWQSRKENWRHQRERLQVEIRKIYWNQQWNKKWTLTATILMKGCTRETIYTTLTGKQLPYPCSWKWGEIV